MIKKLHLCFPTEHALRLMLYYQKLSDSDIAEAVGSTPSKITHWRKAYNLPSHRLTSKKPTERNIPHRPVTDSEVISCLYGLIVCQQSAAELCEEHKRDLDTMHETLRCGFAEFPELVSQYQAQKNRDRSDIIE